MPFKQIHLHQWTNENSASTSYGVEIDNQFYDLFFPTNQEDPINRGAYFIDSLGIKQRVFIVDERGEGAFLFKDTQFPTHLMLYNIETDKVKLGTCTAEISNGNVSIGNGCNFNVFCLPADDKRMLEVSYGKTRCQLIEKEANSKLASHSTQISHSQRLIPAASVMRSEIDKFAENINMMVLGGFIAVVGIAAVAVAFTVLNAATLGTVIVAGIGIAAVLSGIGLFAVGAYKNSQTNTEDQCTDSLGHQYQ